ncbi:unnamed protein product [Protopolystoma xenopodis]|uniref:Septin-type G domain-containing protein n=1 Tax=Protopolystoma xenopodis TaxID=117903 RepID=A0A448X217_9PLAT|nr:unnamed protein product [Protopolystoma xenopodis]
MNYSNVLSLPFILDGGLTEEEIRRIQGMRARVPFAVVGSNTVITSASGKKIRARSYPWGVVEVDNLEHNDFSALRHLLLTVHMQDLLETTHLKHYEAYRFNKLSGIAQMSHFVTRDGKDPMLLMEAEKREHESKMLKMEKEMEAVFEKKVNK